MLTPNQAQKEDLMRPPLRWSEEQLNETPSIKDGIAVEDERIERYLACQNVRDLIRDVFKSKHADIVIHVQILGCYYLQLFFMFQSMKHFDARNAVALAAARLACKVFDEKPRGGVMYLELERLRIKQGREGLSEDEKKDIRQQASEIEIFLLRLTNFSLDISLPCDDIEFLVEKALVKLSCADAFKKFCGEKSPVAEANNLKAIVTASSKQFLSDAFMGTLPLKFSLRCGSLSAILFALRYTVRKIAMDELMKIMVQDNDDDGVDQKTLQSAFEEILTVFKRKAAAEKKAKAPSLSAPQTPATSAVAGGTPAAAPPAPAGPTPASAAQAKASMPPPASTVMRERSRSRER